VGGTLLLMFGWFSSLACFQSRGGLSSLRPPEGFKAAVVVSRRTTYNCANLNYESTAADDAAGSMQ
jgi:hypothetical protein